MSEVQLKALEALDRLWWHDTPQPITPEEEKQCFDTIRAALNGAGDGWRSIDDWHEDMGSAFWTKFPVCEPYYSGSPLDCEWPGYHTHFILMSVFNHLLDRNGMPIAYMQPPPSKDTP